MINQKPLSGDLLDYGELSSQGLVGFWPFNSDGNYLSDKVFDLSGNGNTGTLIADTHWISGKFGSALSFDGTGDYVNTGALNYSANKDWTWSGLFKIDDKPGGNAEYPIAGGQGDVAHTGWSAGGIGVLSGAVWTLVQCQVYDGAYKTAQTPQVDDLSANTLYHAVGVLRGSNIEIWLNGVLKATTAVTLGGITFNPTYSFIGKHGGGAMKGDIDTPIVWNRALSSSEITSLCQEPFCMIRTRRRRIIYDGVEAAPTTFPYYYREIASRRIA